MWRVLGTGAPKTLHVAQIYHLIWRTLNAGTCRPCATARPAAAGKSPAAQHDPASKV